MSCVDEAVCGRFGPPTYAQHLGQVIEQIDRVQKRVRDMSKNWAAPARSLHRGRWGDHAHHVT